MNEWQSITIKTKTSPTTQEDREAYYWEARECYNRKEDSKIGIPFPIFHHSKRNTPQSRQNPLDRKRNNVDSKATIYIMTIQYHCSDETMQWILEGMVYAINHTNHRIHLPNSNIAIPFQNPNHPQLMYAVGIPAVYRDTNLVNLIDDLRDNGLHIDFWKKVEERDGTAKSKIRMEIKRMPRKTTRCSKPNQVSLQKRAGFRIF
jgi:hypothetical protein